MRLSRRQFVIGAGALGGSIAGASLTGGCSVPFVQQAQSTKVHRIGMLGPNEPDSANAKALLQGLRELGYIEGQNLVIEWRYVATRDDRPRELAAELVNLSVDVIVAGGLAVFAAKEVTSTIPIVMGTSGDPVGTGLVASLARPGGNVTGLSNLSVGLAAKRLQLLKETISGASRVAILWTTATSGSALSWRELEAAAPRLGVELLSLEVRTASDFNRVFEAATAQSPHALYIVPDSLLDVVRFPQILEFAAGHRLPVMCNWPHEAAAGALMSYGPSLVAQYRRAAYYVDRILKGTNPADLPVEQPMTFDIVVNMRTARELGITLPQEVALQVTKVID